MANPSLQIGNDNWAIKEDNLLGYSTAGTRFVPQPITMTRATLGTRVNPSGLVEDVELLGSELVTCGDFSCATPSTYWTATNAVISFDNNQLTVDDTAGAGGDSRGSQTITTENGKTYRLTFNRISTTSLFYLGVGSGAGYNNIFYSSLGTDTGEYTLDFTATSSSTTIAFISGGNGITVFSNISVKEATIDNLPRVDYTDGTSSLLVEPQRTNVNTDSQDFSKSFYIKDSGVSVGDTNFVSPSGESNASQIEVNNNLRIYANVASDTYASSVFIKAGTFAYFNFLGSNVDLVAGTFSGGTIESFGNGWFKITKQYTGNRPFQIQAYPDGTYSSHTTYGNYYIWGSQIEAGSYATSYIPTSGSTVTRNQETYTKTGISDLINSEEGVLFAEIAALSNDGTYRQILLHDNAYSDRIALRYMPTSNQIDVYLNNGTVQAQFSYNLSNALDFNKIAFKYKQNDFALWVNGVEVGTDTSGSTFSANTLQNINFDFTNNYFFYGKVKQLQIFKTALTDSELATLTTI